MTRKKLLLVAENWPPRVGGIERYLHGMMQELAITHDVTVIAPLAGKSDYTDAPGITVIRKRFFWPIVRPSWLPLYIFIHRLARNEKFDLVVCGKGLFEGLVGYYLKRHLKIPFAVCAYAMEIAEWNKKKPTQRKLARVLRNADKVIIISDVVRSTLESLGVDSSAIVKIHPAIDTAFLDKLERITDADAVLKKYDVKKPYVLTVSRLIARKGIDDTIQAFAKLDQVKFGDMQYVIVGDGPEREHLEKIAAQEYIKPLFLADVSDSDLPALYANAELFVLTPKDIEGDVEGFGIVYLEAAAAGLATLGTKTGGVPEAVADRETGILVTPGDIDAIAKAMTELLGNPDLRQRLGDAGKKRVQEMFTWEKLNADNFWR